MCRRQPLCHGWLPRPLISRKALGPPENLEQSKSPHPPPGLARHRCLYCLLHRDLVQIHALHCTCMLPQTPLPLHSDSGVSHLTSLWPGACYTAGMPHIKPHYGEVVSNPCRCWCCCCSTCCLYCCSWWYRRRSCCGCDVLSDPRCCTLFLAVFCLCQCFLPGGNVLLPHPLLSF